MGYNISDNYARYGTNIEELKNLLQEVDRATTYREWDCEDVEVLMYKEHDDEKVYFRRINSKSLKEMEADEKRPVPRTWLRTNAIPEDMLKEMIESTGIILYVPDQMGAFFVSEFAMPTLLARADLKGERMMTNTFARNLYMAEGLFNSGKTMKCVLRSVEVAGKKQSKIFGCFTPKYAQVPLIELPRIAEVFIKDGKLGAGKVKNWSFTQDFTNIAIEFPDEAQEYADYYDIPDKVFPGIIICSSETGASSLIVKSTVRLEGQKYPVVTKEIKARHLGKIDIDELIKDVDDQLFSEVRKLPERMEELFKTPACPDGKTDVRRIERLIRHGIRKLGFYKVLGKKRSQFIAEQLVSEINPDAVYSMYDIVCSIMTVGDRLESLSDNLRRPLQEICAKAPYIEYDSSKDGDDDTELVLMPPA